MSIVGNLVRVGTTMFQNNGDKRMLFTFFSVALLNCIMLGQILYYSRRNTILLNGENAQYGMTLRFPTIEFEGTWLSTSSVNYNRLEFELFDIVDASNTATESLSTELDDKDQDVDTL